MSEPCGLTPEQIAEFSAKGWVVVEGFLGSDELAALQREAERLCSDRSNFDKRGHIPNSVVRHDRIDPISDLSPPIKALTESPALRRMIEQVIGPSPQLLKDKFIAKPPGAIGYGPHQDFAYWQQIGMRQTAVASAAIFLDDATAENGTLEFTVGQHHALLTPEGIRTDPNEEDLGEFVTVSANAGDMILFSALAPHRSGTNNSETHRRSLYLTFAVDERQNLRELYEAHDDRYHQ